MQEVFQDAVLNYYRKHNVKATPMVFLGTDFWDPAAYDPVHYAPGTHPKPVYPLVRKLAAEAGSRFSDSLLLSDDPDEIIAFLKTRDAIAAGALTIADVRLFRR